MEVSSEKYQELRGEHLANKKSHLPLLLLPPSPLEQPAKAASPHPKQTRRTAAAFMSEKDSVIIRNLNIHAADPEVLAI